MASYGTATPPWKKPAAPLPTLAPRDAIIPDSEDDDDGYSSSELPSLADLIAGKTRLKALLTPAQTAAVSSAPDVQVVDDAPSLALTAPTRNSTFATTIADTANTANTANGAIVPANGRVVGRDVLQNDTNTAGELGDGSLFEMAPPSFLEQQELQELPKRGGPRKAPGSAPAKPRARKKQADESTAGGEPAVAKKPRQRKAKTQAQAHDGEAADAEAPKKIGRPRKRAETTSNYFDEPAQAKGDGGLEVGGHNRSVAAESGAGKGNVKGRGKVRVRGQEADKEPEPEPGQDEPLNLERAVQRKARWTPPPTMAVAATNPIPKTAHHASSDMIVLSSDTGIEGDASMFLELKERFACDEVRPEPPPRKRKMVDAASATTEPGDAATGTSKAPAKKRAPKKKARTITITELATKAFRVQEDEDEQMMDEDTSTASASKIGQARGPQAKPPRQRQSNARARASAKTKKKPQPPPPPILLSPGQALEQASAQAFVFGTSSQLLREDSPGVLRDIQEAIRLSAIEEQPAALIEIDSDRSDDALALPINSDAIEPAAAKPKLWEAGARAEDGSLLQLDIDDPVEMPGVAEQVQDPFGYFAPAPKAPITCKGMSQPGAEAVAPFSFSSSLAGKRTGSGGGVVVDPDSPAFVASFPINGSFDNDPFFASANLPPPSAQARACSFSPSPSPREATPESPIKKSAGVPLPNFESYTDVQLAREVASFGFKQIKRRSAMIAILTQCWESKRGRIAGRAAVIPPPEADSQKAAEPATEMARKRGRPSKDNVAENAPTKPMRRGRPRTKGMIAEDGKGGGVEGEECVAGKKEKGKRGRPRKRADAEDEAAKPKRRRRRKASSSSSNSSSSSSSRRSRRSRSSCLSSSSPSGGRRSLLAGADDVDPADMSILPDREEEAFECITKAIISQPRSLDPLEPSWHERILIYDAVVLEDLAAWLNLGPLTQAGWDGEVTPADIKKWGEQRGVLCLWREALRGRGGER